jgi:uncharacterized repeat protein (TIGR01451 family)
MKHLPPFFSLMASVVLGTCAKAQVYIPSQDLRAALNAQVPDLVDGAGMMDESDEGIAQIDSLYLALGPVNPTIDLTGIEHLYGLSDLRITMFDLQPFIDTLVIPAFPASLENLIIAGEDERVILGMLPDGIRSVTVMFIAGDAQGGISFGGFPVHLPSLELRNIPAIEWPGTASIGSVLIGSSETALGITIPPLITEMLDLVNVHASDLDLSEVAARQVRVNEMRINGDLSWPTSVESLSYHNTWGQSLSNWPSELDTLIVTYATERCIPVLPNSVDHLYLYQDINCIPNWPTELVSYLHGTTTFNAANANYCSVLNSDCPGTYPALAGVVRMDLNNNGLVDAGEPIVPSSSVSIAPGGQSTGCASDGSWQIGVPLGEHTITAASGYPYVVSMSPSSHAGSVPAMGDVDLNNDFAVAVQPDIKDLRVHVYADPARPGFDNQVHLRCENYGTTPVDAELILAFDADQTWIGSSVAPASTSTNTATWSFPAMPIGAVQHIVVDLTTAPTVALGTDITHTLTADPTSTDETPLDNVYTFNDSVVGSYDPNDKLLSPAVLTPDEVALGETPIEYTIRFQNTGTYLAERVVILDTLSDDLQWGSMRFIASSHDQHWYIVDGVLHVIHNDIMLPDSNANEPESHGFFKFSMLPKTDLDNGSTIENIAHIVFDLNAPIVTPPAVFTVDIGAGIEAGSTTSALRILPNPAHDRIQLIVDDATVLPYRILDLLGQEVQRGTAQPNAWIDVQALANGSYVLEVTKAGVPTSLRFMKQ